MSAKSDFSKEEKLIDLCLEHGIDLVNRVITFCGDLEEGYFAIFDFALTRMEKESRKSITIKINTYGGDTHECMALVARIKESNCHIVTKAYGKCMSSGLVLLASGDKRLVSKYCTVMHHPVSYDTGDDKHPVNEAYVKQIAKEEEKRLRYLAEVTETSYAKWKKITNPLDHYLTAEECVEMGIANEVF